MEFRLLGAVELWDGDRVLEIGPPQRRSLLTALAIDAGRQVTLETLVSRVWGPVPPERARRSLQAHVARIRRVLEQAGAGGRPVRLVHRAGGYLLEADRDGVDLHRFGRLVELAHDPGRADAERLALLTEAIGLWRGEPLGGLPGEWAARMRAGWQRQYVDAVVAWADAKLRVGEPRGVIEPLTDLLAEHPLVESLAAALMRALHAAGRTAEALDCYTAIRGRLGAERGIEPGPELRTLERTIRGSVPPAAEPAAHPPAAAQPAAAHQPAAVQPAAAHLPAAVQPAAAQPATQPAAAEPVAAGPRTAESPAQLPLDVPGFAGRAGELARLDEILDAADGQPAAVVISAVLGTAGVGKTALAVHWAHRVRHRYPDGQLYLNLRGYDLSGSPLSATEALPGLLVGLGLPPAGVPASADEQAACYRSLLAGRRVLILLDNARDAEQVRPLLPGAAGCLVLVTSRSQLPSLIAAEGAHPLSLDLLTPADAEQLLARRLGPARLAAEPAAVAEIVSRCARLPLALAVVAARATVHPQFPLAAVAAELRDARGWLDALDGGDSATDLRAVFSWSYGQLRTPAARAVFRLLGLHPGPDVAPAAVASLAGLPVQQVRPLLAELARAHLVVEHVPGRFAFHDLLRAYAAELASIVDSEATRHAALRRVLDYYLHTACAADRLLYPYRDPIVPVPASPGVAPAEFAGHDEAYDWLTAERPVLIAAARQAASAGLDTHCWQLAWAMVNFLERRGHWQDQTLTHEGALAAALRSGDLAGQAYSHRGQGRADFQSGRDEQAHAGLRRALDLFAQLGDCANEAGVHLDIAVVFERQGRYAEALRHDQRALELFEAAGHPAGQARALNNLGYCHTLLGDHRKSLGYCQRALALRQHLGDRTSEADTWDSLGHAHQHLGDHAAAVACYRQALALYEEAGDCPYRAGTLDKLGDTELAAGDPGAAARTWRQALAVLDSVRHPEADRIRAKLHELGAERGRPERTAPVRGR